MTKESNQDSLIAEVIFVIDGDQAGRIGFCDEVENGEALIYFGHMLEVSGYIPIPADFVREATSNDLYNRSSEIRTTLMQMSYNVIEDDLEWKLELVQEARLIESTVYHRRIAAHFGVRNEEGAKVFLAHASVDKGFVRRIYDDLVSLGHKPWIDEVEILAGENIPLKIQEGIRDCDYMCVFFSSNSDKSKWLPREWTSKLVSEIESNETQIIPVKIEGCEVPEFLRSKKYVSFEEDYFDALQEIHRVLVKTR